MKQSPNLGNIQAPKSPCGGEVALQYLYTKPRDVKFWAYFTNKMSYNGLIFLYAYIITPILSMVW